MSRSCIVLRLAGPLQSWGITGQYNRRDTASQPTKSGIVGLLAAAQGRRRGDSLEDLVALRLGVRTDQQGTLMQDFHTVSRLDGAPLWSANVTAKGLQRPTSPKKLTHVTKRLYLQDAVFVAVVEGQEDFVADLASAVRRPRFQLALGRRACVPTQPMVLRERPDGDAWWGDVQAVLDRVPWQASDWYQRRQGHRAQLPAVWDEAEGEDLADDVPVSFAHSERGFLTRSVTHGWVTVGAEGSAEPSHDPFAILGW